MPERERRSTQTVLAWAILAPAVGLGPYPEGVGGVARPLVHQPADGDLGRAGGSEVAAWRALEVVSDSTYVVNCFRDRWWEKWLAKGWTGRLANRWPTATSGNPSSTFTGERLAACSSNG